MIALRGAAVEAGAVHVELNMFEPGVRQARLKHTTPARGWLQGLRWGHRQRYGVQSLDARLLLRVFVERDLLQPDRCLGSVTLRLSTIRALCQRARAADGGGAADEASAAAGGRGGDAAAAGGAGAEGAAGEGGASMYWCPPRWFALRAGKKRKEALRAEEEEGVPWLGTGGAAPPTPAARAGAPRGGWAATDAGGRPFGGGTGELEEEEEEEEEYEG